MMREIPQTHEVRSLESQYEGSNQWGAELGDDMSNQQQQDQWASAASHNTPTISGRTVTTSNGTHNMQNGAPQTPADPQVYTSPATSMALNSNMMWVAPLLHIGGTPYVQDGMVSVHRPLLPGYVQDGMAVACGPSNPCQGPHGPQPPLAPLSPQQPAPFPGQHQPLTGQQQVNLTALQAWAQEKLLDKRQHKDAFKVMRPSLDGQAVLLTPQVVDEILGNPQDRQQLLGEADIEPYIQRLCTSHHVYHPLSEFTKDNKGGYRKTCNRKLDKNRDSREIKEGPAVKRRAAEMKDEEQQQGKQGAVLMVRDAPAQERSVGGAAGSSVSVGLQRHWEMQMHHQLIFVLWHTLLPEQQQQVMGHIHPQQQLGLWKVLGSCTQMQAVQQMQGGQHDQGCEQQLQGVQQAQAEEPMQGQHLPPLPRQPPPPPQQQQQQQLAPQQQPQQQPHHQQQQQSKMDVDPVQHMLDFFVQAGASDLTQQPLAQVLQPIELLDIDSVLFGETLQAPQMQTQINEHQQQLQQQPQQEQLAGAHAPLAAAFHEQQGPEERVQQLQQRDGEYTGSMMQLLEEEEQGEEEEEHRETPQQLPTLAQQQQQFALSQQQGGAAPAQVPPAQLPVPSGAYPLSAQIGKVQLDAAGPLRPQQLPHNQQLGVATVPGRQQQREAGFQAQAASAPADIYPASAATAQAYGQPGCLPLWPGRHAGVQLTTHPVQPTTHPVQPTTHACGVHMGAFRRWLSAPARFSWKRMSGRLSWVMRHHGHGHEHGHGHGPGLATPTTSTAAQPTAAHPPHAA